MVLREENDQVLADKPICYRPARGEAGDGQARYQPVSS